MTEPPNREVVVLNGALELLPAERAAYLDQACAGDPALREQVEALLAAHERADSFLEAPPASLDFKRTVRVELPLTEKPGDKIGRYKLLQQIGEGGCGVVYMAEQEEPVRRRVALKVIKLGMDTKQVIARFEAERQALALMDHPNIAKVLDAGSTDTGRPYFVMELVRGVKITEFCDDNKLPTEKRLKLFIQVCQAIQHAHQKGVIHRDIKPSNILVTINDGVPVPKVIDFGIAKATQGRLTDQTLFTAFEQFIGTPAYMSPEQAVMTSLDIDTRSDIYSLGVLLYELLTGHTPFDAKELHAAGLDEMRRTIREQEPPKPSTRLTQELVAAPRQSAGDSGGENGGALPRRRYGQIQELVHLVRGDLDWIVMKALEKDRTRRYETANSLAMDIQCHLNNEPVNARPPSNLYRLQKLAQRNRLTFAAVGAVAVATLLALVVLIVSTVRITRERNQKDLALKEKDVALKEKGSALDAARASEHRAKDELFGSLRSQAQTRRYSRQMGQRLDSLAALAEAARIRIDPGLTDDAIAAMALPDIRQGPKCQASETNYKPVAFDSLCRRYARIDSRGVISIRSVSDDRELQRLDSHRPPELSRIWGSLLFSPDGRFLVNFEEGSRLRVWRLEDAHSVLRDAPEKCTAAAFSPNSRQIAVGQEGWILCFDLATGRERNRWKTSGEIYTLALSPDNSRVAVGYFDQTNVSVYAAADGREIVQLPVGSSPRESVCWHPDGKRLVVGGSDPGIQIWDVDALRKVATLEGHVQEVSYLAFHPDGELLASGSWDGVVRLWDAATGRQAMQIPLASGTLQFSLDGRWLGVSGPTAEHGQLLEVTAAQEYHTLGSSSGPGQGAYFCDISPGSRLLVVGMDDGVRLWDLPTCRELAFLAIGLTPSVLFASAGTELLTCSPSTLQRWPIHASDSDASGHQLTIGPPQPIQLPFAPHRISRSRDGRTMAVLSEASEKTMLLDLAEGSIRGQEFPHQHACFVALSPDARWLATSGWHSHLVRLWDAQSGALVHELDIGQQTKVSFTPDSRALIMARGGEFSFLEVNTLEISRRLRREIGLYAADVAFSPDDKLMAMEMSPGVIHLKEVSTGRTVAKLEDPYADRSTWIAFTPDGTKLIVLAMYAKAIHVWDLRAIRARLKTMSLDWDWPEFPPAIKPDETRMSLARPTLKIQVVNTQAR